jgi:hypothetical protein
VLKKREFESAQHRDDVALTNEAGGSGMAAQFHKVHFRQISLGMPHVRQVLFTLLTAICKNACNALFMPAPTLRSHSAAACVHSARSNGFAMRAAAAPNLMHQNQCVAFNVS